MIRYLIRPLLEKLGYLTIRADEENTLGLISRITINQILTSDIVIADIIDENQNVFYQLAIRNAIAKPLIIIKSSHRNTPFDIQDNCAISIDKVIPYEWKKIIMKLEDQVFYAEKNPLESSCSILSNFIKSFKIDEKNEQDSNSNRIYMKGLQEELLELTRIVNHHYEKQSRESSYQMNVEKFVSLRINELKFTQEDLIKISVSISSNHFQRKICRIWLQNPFNKIIYDMHFRLDASENIEISIDNQFELGIYIVNLEIEGQFINRVFSVT